MHLQYKTKKIKSVKKPTLFLWFLVFCISANHAQSQEAKLSLEKIKPTAGKPAFVNEAQKELSGLSSLNDIAWLLGELVLISTNPAQKKFFLAERASSLELLARYSEAASSWEEAARLSADKLDIPSLISAAACHLAYGNLEAASLLLGTLGFSSPDLASKRRIALAEGWLLLAKGRADQALSKAEQLLTDSTLSKGSSEYQAALILAVSSTDGSIRDSYIRQMASIKPDPQIGFIPFTMLLGFDKTSYLEAYETGSGLAAGTIKPAYKIPSDTEGQNKAMEQTGMPDSIFYQLGAFRDETNAKAFAVKISELGLKPVLGRKNGDGFIIVYIDGGADPGKTVLILKDAGYEAWALKEKP